jgi:hypothetical protein
MGAEGAAVDVIRKFLAVVCALSAVTAFALLATHVSA